MNNSTIQQIFKPLSEGMAVTLLTGRPIYDLDSNSNMGITTLVSEMCNYAHKKYNMALVRYCLANGVAINERAYNADEAKQIKDILTEVNIMGGSKCNTGKCEAGQELIDILKGFSRLSREKKYLDAKWSDGRPLRFMFMLEFSSDILPESMNVNQLVASELSYISAHSLIIRDSGNYLVLNDVVEGKIEPKVSNILPNISIRYPAYEDKLEFLNVLHSRYPNAKYEKELDDKQVANLSSNTPNRGLEGLFLGSERTGSEITATQLIEQKVKDVSAISESTLTLLDVERIKNVELVGATIGIPKQFLTKCAQGLREKDTLTPTNILLLGAPSTGKTDLALMTAAEANVPAYGLNSPKAGIVGETERKAKLQMKVFKSMSPNLGFIDEISEAFPMARSNNNLDSGASAAVTAALLESLSDKSREGNSILIATSNCGWRVGGAMLSRFDVLPVLMPVVTDFPMIISSIVKNISPETLTDITDERVKNAAEIFYNKNLMPRQIRSALKLAMSLRKSLAPEDILWAAKDANPLDYISHLSAIYSDYYALQLCKSNSLLPWNENPNFPFPDYIAKILDSNGDIDAVKLNEEMNKLKPYVNV
jgi:AAA+ superfamily predicted ATPase